PPLSVLHPPLPIPPLTSTQCPPPLSATPPLSVLHPSLPIPPLVSTRPTNKSQNTNNLQKAIHNSAPSYITNLVSKYQPNLSLRSSQDLL
ncbi:unnamed protein product, partial [Staurois parvus]